MYGNVITNRQFRALYDSKSIDIRPFSETKLKEAAYTLNPGKIWKISEDGSPEVVFSFNGSRASYTIAADEYVIVEPQQAVSIRVPGIVGTFIVASPNIEKGLLVVAGQIDSRYGMKGEALKFGVKNLLSRPNQILMSDRLVHLQLIDLRGSAADPVKMSKSQRQTWDNRGEGTLWVDDPRNVPNYGAVDPDDE